MRRARVGDLIELQRRRIDVDPLETYEEIGIRSFGRGIFHKEPVTGAALGAKRVFKVCPGDLVLNNVFAWEGAVALAGPTEAGKCGSHRFLTYTGRDQNVDLSYLLYFFVSEVGLVSLGAASPGSAGRNRTLAIERFENLVIPLPTREEQIGIVRRLDALLSRVRRLGAVNSSSAVVDSALTESAIQTALGAKVFPTRPLGEVAEINPRPQPVTGLVAFVPMSSVDDKRGVIQSPELKDADEIGSGYKQFRNGDVIFARITPCMQNGKAAVVALEKAEVGLGSTEFHVIRAGSEVLPEWIHAVVRTRRFRDAAAERFTGTAGQQRVPADFLRTAAIPVPPLDDQSSLLLRVEQIETLAGELRRARSSAVARAHALEASLLNHVFGSMAKL